ncbi:MAG TPA: twin-arginine translocase subunit TatC [Terriglobales bacterium]|jgi:sec-independent protein translocase protein TatC|nr:twin-arginine translocase subunit TatC [Terriglobales bacterium]
MPELMEENSSSPSRMEQMKSMSLIEHLEELRRRIIWSIVWVGVFFFFCWGYAAQIFHYVQQPVIDALRENKLPQTLVYTNPTDPFNLYMKTGLVAGIFLASPFVLYNVWLFISPGLYRREKRYVFPFMFSTVALFLCGGFFGYKMVFPQALTFLISYGSQFTPMITVTEYTSLFLTIILGLGVIFEMPILIFFLALMGIVSARWLWRNLRYSILIIFIIAAVLTPTTDILNMCIFAAPMIALYILSIGIAWLVHPSRRKARAQQS